jgi:hypothetical protein
MPRASASRVCELVDESAECRMPTLCPSCSGTLRYHAFARSSCLDPRSGTQQCGCCMHSLRLRRQVTCRCVCVCVCVCVCGWVCVCMCVCVRVTSLCGWTLCCCVAASLTSECIPRTTTPPVHVLNRCFAWFPGDSHATTIPQQLACFLTLPEHTCVRRGRVQCKASVCGARALCLVLLCVRLHCLRSQRSCLSRFISLCLCDCVQDDLLDLYLYYCLVGIHATSPSLRAACVAMLSVIATHNTDVVVGAIGKSCQFICVHACAHLGSHPSVCVRVCALQTSC